MERMLLPDFHGIEDETEYISTDRGRSLRSRYGHDGVTKKDRLRTTRTLRFEETHTDGAGYTGYLTDLTRI